jgi:uncharacterized protein
MRIKVADIPAEGTVLEINTPSQSFPELKQLEADGECRFKKDIFAHIEIRKVAGLVEVTGRIETKTSATCSRCLAEYESPVVHHFTVDFTHELPEPEAAEEEIALRAQDLGVTYYKGDSIDFHDTLQEQVILSLPLRPLCREDCRGLCHRCGENLNEGNCRCRNSGVIDPRFAVLSKLKLPPVKG